MVGSFLLAALLVQQPQVAVGVDLDRVRLGDEIVLTITVRARNDLPLEIVDPDLTGLELLTVRQQSRGSPGGAAPSRATTRTLTLRAVAVGEAVIGPVIVRQGDEEVITGEITVTVGDSPGGSTPRLEPRVSELLRSIEPEMPSAEQVALTVSIAPDTVTLGSQVDVLVAAWVPREIRRRMRHPPTFEPPAVRGAWAYPRPTPAGIALSRVVGGIEYDLFVQHSIIFPLSAGAVEIAAAKVSYSLPISYSFLSREIRHEVRSEPRSVTVRALPSPPRGGAFRGAIGAHLTLEVEAPPVTLPLGGAAHLSAAVRGMGNVELWPEPELQWPVGLRVYPQDVVVVLEPKDGLIGGAKIFHYLVVADSVGTHRVAISSYAYFDTDDNVFGELEAAPIELVTPGGPIALGVSPTAPRPLLEAPGGRSLAARLSRVPAWLWLLVVLGPPGAAVAFRNRGRWSRLLPHGRRVREEPSAIAQTEREFRTRLERLVPHAMERPGHVLADALRAAGVEASLAEHAARLRDRLRYAIYGPDDATDAEELSLEVAEVLRALVVDTIPSRPLAAPAAVVLLLTIGCVGAAGGQSAERLYGAGAVRAAADSFLARTGDMPLVAAHWYNLGNSWSRLGDPARARAAWTRAARLAPRVGEIQAVGKRLSRSAAGFGGLTWVSPVTPPEALLLASVMWVLGWLSVAARVPQRLSLAVLTLALVAAGYGVAVKHRYASPLAFVLRDHTPLRMAPYGPAPSSMSLDRASAVQVEREEGEWVLVSRDGGRGWVLGSEIIGL